MHRSKDELCKHRRSYFAVRPASAAVAHDAYCAVSKILPEPSVLVVAADENLVRFQNAVGVECVAAHGAEICLMHMKGDPQTMQDAPSYTDPVGEVCAFLEARLRAAVDAGIGEDRVVLDPGIGFGKRLQDNLALLANIDRIVAIGRPVVVGVSRKRMFDGLLGRAVDERLAGSLSAGLAAVTRGAAVLRVHDVRETCDALRTWAAIEEAR